MSSAQTESALRKTNKKAQIKALREVLVENVSLFKIRTDYPLPSPLLLSTMGTFFLLFLNME